MSRTKRIVTGVLIGSGLTVLGVVALQRGTWEPSLRATFVAAVAAVALSVTLAGGRPLSLGRFSFIFGIGLAIVGLRELLRHETDGDPFPFSRGTLTLAAVTVVGLLASRAILRRLANRAGPPPGRAGRYGR